MCRIAMKTGTGGMMARFGEWLPGAIPVGGRTGFSLFTRVSFMAVLAMTASAYADKEKRDYFGDYRVPAGFVYSEATITPFAPPTYEENGKYQETFDLQEEKVQEVEFYDTDRTYEEKVFVP
jgi:hypothetical protein